MDNDDSKNSAPLATLTDSSLLRRIQGGNQDAATQLYFRYAQRLRDLANAEVSADLARRVDADDIVQSVFASFFRGAGQGYYNVPAGHELWKLLLVIALNKIRAKGAYHRAAKRDVRQTASFEHLDGLTGDAQGDPEAQAILKMVIEDAIEAFPEAQRQAVMLRIEGYEVAEIGVRTQRSKRTIERILQDFRKKLMEILPPEHGPAKQEDANEG